MKILILCTLITITTGLFIYSVTTLLYFYVQKGIKKEYFRSTKAYAIVFGTLGALAGFVTGYMTQNNMTATILLALGFGFICYPVPYALEQMQLKSFKKNLLFMSYYFEIAVKHNLPLDRVILLIADTIDNRKQRKLVQNMAAVYKQTKNIDESFKAFEHINIPELELLKSVLKEYERFGQQGILAIQTFSNIQQQNCVYDMTVKEKTVDYIIMGAGILVLFGAILCLIEPLFSNLLQNLSTLF